MNTNGRDSLSFPQRQPDQRDRPQMTLPVRPDRPRGKPRFKLAKPKGWSHEDFLKDFQKRGEKVVLDYADACYVGKIIEVDAYTILLLDDSSGRRAIHFKHDIRRVYEAP